MSIDGSDKNQSAILQVLDCVGRYAELVIHTETGKSVDSGETSLQERYRAIGAEDEAFAELENCIDNAWLRARSICRLVTRHYADDDNTTHW